MKSLILIRGLPGSGKSTFARKKFSSSQYVHLEADMWFINHKLEYKFNPNMLTRAHNWCQDSARIFLQQGGMNVVVSNTFTKLEEMKFYLDLAKESDAELQVYKMTQNYGSVHNVPAEVIEKMKRRWQDYDGEIYV